MLAKSSLFSTNAPKIQKKWVDIEDVSQQVVRAVVAAEDNKFYSHSGFDWDEINAAWKSNKRGKKLRGASTISQQTAKNTCLWPRRSWVRKGLEVYYTVLLEAFWSKQRIMEVYLNVAELGKGIYGVQQASLAYYSKPPSKITKSEAALLATVLPSPARRNPKRPSQYMLKYQQNIIGKMNNFGNLLP